MSGNDFEPIRDRLKKILGEASPGPEAHLTPEEIDAFARKPLGPKDAIPEHLSECPWCWSRVFETRRRLAQERLEEKDRAMVPLLRLPVAFLEKAVEFARPVPGLRSAYAFGGMSVSSELWDARLNSLRLREAQPPAPRRVRSLFSRLQRFADTGDAAEETEISAMRDACPSPAFSMAPEPDMDIEPEPQSVVIPLPVEGISGVLIVTRRANLCDLQLTAYNRGTIQSAPVLLLMLEHNGEKHAATADENGFLRLTDIPLGQYDLIIEAAPDR